MEQEIKECCDWLNCQLDDIQTFLQGIENHVKGNHSQFPGGGNLSAPILIYSHLEFISALYCGEAKETFEEKRCDKSDKCNRKYSNYDATKNVKLFAEKFFPNDYQEYPLIFWDGIRNAVTHRFSPKAMSINIIDVEYVIHFKFYVDDRNVPAYAENINNHIFIYVNIFELFAIIQKATRSYFSILEYDKELQNKCLVAWKAIKEYQRSISPDDKKYKEAKKLITNVNKSKGSYSFKKQINVKT